MPVVEPSRHIESGKATHDQLPGGSSGKGSPSHGEGSSPVVPSVVSAPVESGGVEVEVPGMPEVPSPVVESLVVVVGTVLPVGGASAVVLVPVSAVLLASLAEVAGSPGSPQAVLSRRMTNKGG
ncbi:hypothetical protein [Nannocystis pusilla]|uniref:hypothetical protein n=1 Tax=Nannocystis pusilla TaxID=889268 RepID=UPI003B7A42D4